MKSSTYIKIVIILTIIAFIFISAGYIINFKKKQTINIVAFLSLTGPASNAGKDVKDGLLLAQEEINSWRGIKNKKINIIVEDIRIILENKSIFNKYEKEYNPLLYLTTTSQTAMKLAPLAEKNQAIHIGLVATSDLLTKNKDWIFKYFTSPETETEPIIKILKRIKVNRLGILYLNDDYGNPVSSLLGKKFKSTDGFYTKIPFDVHEKSFQDKIDKLKDMEAIYIVGYQFHIKHITEQLKKNGYKGAILVCNSIDTTFAENNSTLEDVYTATPLIYNPKFTFAKEVNDKFQLKYNKPLNHFSANGYDFMKLLSGLLDNEKEITRENLKFSLETGIIFPSIFGSIEIKPGQHDILIPLVPAIIKQGKIRYLKND